MLGAEHAAQAHAIRNREMYTEEKTKAYQSIFEHSTNDWLSAYLTKKSSEVKKWKEKIVVTPMPYWHR